MRQAVCLRTGTALAGVALFAVGYLSMGTAATASSPVKHVAMPPASDPAPPPQPPPAECSEAGPVLRYLVVFDQGTDPRQADDQINTACGSTIAYYAQIAVAVASTPDPRFADRMGRDRAYSAQAETLAVNTTQADPGRRSMDEAPEPRTRSPLSATSSGAVPTADRTGEQWDMAMIHADRVHTVLRGSPNVIVGVLDSGIDATHPDLAAAVDGPASAGCTTGAPDTTPSAWAPTRSSHGTHVAGTIAAADNGQGITGIAPGVRLASVKIVDDGGFIYPEYDVCGLMWAADNGFTITNNSYFVDPWLFTCRDKPGQAVVYEAIRRAVTYATGRGVLTVAATGNDGLDLANPKQDSISPDNVPNPRPRPVDSSCDVLPGGLKGAVTVSSVGAARMKAGYSSYGLGIADVTAPGGDPGQQPGPGRDACVLSTIPGGYGTSCGTSMATPHATGIAALLATRYPGAGPTQLTRLLDGAAEPVPCPADYDLNGDGAQDATCDGNTSYNGFYGHGLVDALIAATE